jgi:pimeloyl-ACP methyl ester carboxylesterase
MKENKMVQVVTSDGLYLHGYFIPPSREKEVVLHVHGFEGNFYENSFVHILADALEDQGVGFLTVNTRGNGKDTDFNTVDGKIKRIGAHYELLEEAHIDISAWVEFLLNQGYRNILLEGHSLGTVKSVRYLFEGFYKDKISKLILLAPFDKKGLMIATGRADLDNLLQKAEQKVSENKGDELISEKFDDTSTSYNTFISWYKQDDLGRMFEFCSHDYDFPILKQIQIPTKIIVGSRDEYFYPTNPEHPEEAMKILLSNIPVAEGRMIENAAHSFYPHEGQMVKEVIGFIKSG